MEGGVGVREGIWCVADRGRASVRAGTERHVVMSGVVGPERYEENGRLNERTTPDLER